MADFNAPVPSGAGELSVSSQASGAVAEVQAAYAAAWGRPRVFDRVRKNLIATCQRKRFSDIALYERIVGKDKNKNDVWATGMSVRMSEAFLAQYPNLMASCQTVYDDDRLRKIAVRVVDLETNATFSMEGTVTKLIERKWATGRDVISERENSEGAKTYLCRAFDHEVDLKEAALRSKLFRDCVLRVIPADLKDELMEVIQAARAGEFKTDPITARKNMVDGFGKAGVTPEMIEKFLGHALVDITEFEFTRMRGIYASVVVEGKSWEVAIGTGTVKLEPEHGKVGLDITNVKPGNVETHTEPGVPVAEQSAAPQGQAATIVKEFLSQLKKKYKVNAIGLEFANRILIEKFGEPSMLPDKDIDALKKWCAGAALAELTAEGFIDG